MNPLKEKPMSDVQPDSTVLQPLVSAACAALRQAFETDLPAVEDVEAVREAEADLPQAERRDLYAARRLCNVTYGPLRRVRRRPALVGMRAFIVPHGDGHRIVVLAMEGSAAIYTPEGARAALAYVISAVADDLTALTGLPLACAP
jgi:hypothetical protein